MMEFHHLVLALVFGWSQVSAEVSPVEISIPPVLNVAENDSNVQVCATLSLRTEVNINFNLAFDSSGTGMCVQQL